MPTPTGATEARPLRVVTFNLLHGGPTSGWFGDGDALEERLEMVTTELRALRPDIVGVQEASAAWGRGNVAARLAESLGMGHVYASATTRVLGMRWLGHVIVRAINFDEGPAVLSRFPIVDSEVFDLPRCAKRLDPRVLLRADVRTPWGDVAVFSTHISRDDCQLARVVEIVREHARTRPALLMGDLNAGETSHEGFVDAFRAANPTTPGLTVWQRPWAPAPTVHRRVDYILVAGAGAEVACASRVMLDQPRRLSDGRTLWPSDHYGVLAELRLFGIKCAP